MDIGILGGGLAGVTIGSLLKKHRVEILEKEDRTGGLCKTISEKGFTFDIGGGHIIFTRDKKILDFMLDALKYNVMINKRNAKILYKNRIVTYPFENGLSELEPQENFECLNEFLKMLMAKAEQKLKNPKNMKDWFYFNFGKGIADKYLVPYSEKIWKIKTEQMGLSWVGRDRLPQPEPEEIIKSSLGINKEGYLVQSKFYYPSQGGIETLIKGISSKFMGKITTNFEVKKIKKSGKKWIVSDGKTEKEFDVLVSTLPLPEIVSCMEKVPAFVKKNARQLRFNSLIEVLIGTKEITGEKRHWLYIPQKDTEFHRIIFISNNSPLMADKNKTGVMTEITCSFNSKIWKKTDEEIIKLTLEQLDKLNILKKQDVVFSKVARFKYAYVVNDFNYESCSNAVKKYLEKQGIVLCGRFSEWKYLNMDATIKSAIETVRKIN